MVATGIGFARNMRLMAVLRSLLLSKRDSIFDANSLLDVSTAHSSAVMKSLERLVLVWSDVDS